MPNALCKNLLLGVTLVVGVSIFAAGRARRRNGALEVVGTKLRISDCSLSTNSTTLDTVSDPDKFLSSLDLNGIQCGEYKCLARDSEPGVGYLISSNYPDLQFDVETTYSWILAEYLRNELGAKHLFHGAPGKVLLVSPHVDQLRNSSHIPVRRRRGGFYRADTEAVIQRVILAPEPFLILKHGESWKRFKYFYRERVENRTEFLQTLKYDVESAIRAVESFPLLAMDFQIILDHRGNIFQFDLDRVFLGGLYEAHNFEELFIKSYNMVMSQLLRFKRFALVGKVQPDRGDLGGKSVIMKYNHSSNLQFSPAFEIVRSMKGRFGDTPKVDMPCTPTAMMTDLVETITRVPCSN